MTAYRASTAAARPRGSSRQPLPAPPVREPATILARPSALAASRLAWTVLCAVVAVTLPPHIATWAPWWAGALVVTCFIDAGPWCATAWAFAVIALTALLPPGGDAPPAHVLAALAAILCLHLLRHLPRVTPFAPLMLGAVACIAHDGALIALSAAIQGVVQVEPGMLLARAVATAVLVGFLAPPWLGWARRERARGRA